MLFRTGEASFRTSRPCGSKFDAGNIYLVAIHKPNEKQMAQPWCAKHKQRQAKKKRNKKKSKIKQTVCDNRACCNTRARSFPYMSQLYCGWQVLSIPRVTFPRRFHATDGNFISEIVFPKPACLCCCHSRCTCKTFTTLPFPCRRTAEERLGENLYIHEHKLDFQTISATRILQHS